MVFKLVRTDGVDPCKIPLSPGNYLFGRGKFLDCNDKRISRQHGELVVATDTITIKALHQNPCFYLKKGTEQVQILRQNSTADLHNGDRFGLLPDLYWYELVYCIDDINAEQDETKLEDTEPLENGIDVINNEDETIGNLDKTDENLDESQSLLSTDNQSLTQVILATDNQNSTQYPQIDQPTVPIKSQPDVQNSPNKRCHSPDDTDDEAKKVKVESDVKVKEEPDQSRPGTSNDQRDSSSSDDKGNNAPPLPANNKNALRERCIYGANCYRKNPEHKAQFSHPSDPDWGPGARGVCPYGGACRKRDPRHWRDHDHPPGAQMPGPNGDRAGQEKKTKKREKSPEVSTDLIVTGKRSRKTIKRPSWSGFEDENEYDLEDPFMTDESDEWLPPSNVGETQDFTQSTEDF